MEISGKTKICGIIGDPVEHSLSPTIHNAAFKKLALDFVYVAFKVKKDELSDAITGAKKLGIHGLNITMPHKQLVMKHLNEIDSTAKSIGAVNTVLNLDGRLVGYNTDGIGALKALRENDVSLHKKKLLLLGAGGAGKAIAFHAAQYVEELVILNRTTSKAKALAKFLRKRFNRKITGNTLSPVLIEKELENADVLVNTTPVGMHSQANQSLVDPIWLRPNLCVMDIIYNPLETKLVKDAKAAGAKVVSGLEMLVYQGAMAFEIWTKQPAPIQTMKQAGLKKILELRETS